jgi:hypothetical protein
MALLLFFMKRGYLKLAIEHTQKCQVHWEDVYSHGKKWDKETCWKWCSSPSIFIIMIHICNALGMKLFAPKRSLLLFQQALTDIDSKKSILKNNDNNNDRDINSVDLSSLSLSLFLFFLLP